MWCRWRVCDVIITCNRHYAFMTTVGISLRHQASSSAVMLNESWRHVACVMRQSYVWWCRWWCHLVLLSVFTTKIRLIESLPSQSKLQSAAASNDYGKTWWWRNTRHTSNQVVLKFTALRLNIRSTLVAAISTDKIKTGDFDFVKIVDCVMWYTYCLVVIQYCWRLTTIFDFLKLHFAVNISWWQKDYIL